MAAAGAAPTADTAADVQTTASYSIMMNPSPSFYVFGEERNIDPQCNVEWPQEIDVDDSFQMDDILGGDIEYESRSSDGSGSDFEDDVEWQQDGYTNVAELFPVPEEELDEAPAPAVDKAAMVREARSKAPKAKASKTREKKLRAAAGTTDDTFVLSDSCSDDNKEIINPSDDDGEQFPAAPPERPCPRPRRHHRRTAGLAERWPPRLHLPAAWSLPSLCPSEPPAPSSSRALPEHGPACPAVVRRRRPILAPPEPQPPAPEPPAIAVAFLPPADPRQTGSGSIPPPAMELGNQAWSPCLANANCIAIKKDATKALKSTMDAGLYR
ncbi:hypothetical protein ZWY2020_045509 [Hordeum vulgare]|nr:hypothetical protein ZWY2020_045509 [Hordeum vulgare]